MKYMICVTNRVGSSWLCSMLASTKVAGNPTEHFNLPEGKWPKFREHYEAISKLNPLGIKTSYNGLVRAAAFVGEAEFRGTPCIHLKRRDTLAQAISNYRAMVTGQWYRTQGEPNASPDCNPDCMQILQLKQQYEETNEQLWPKWFQRMQIDPLEIWYENMIEAPLETVQSVCRFLGFPRPSEVDTEFFGIQRDDLSQRWKEFVLSQAGRQVPDGVAGLRRKYHKSDLRRD